MENGDCRRRHDEYASNMQQRSNKAIHDRDESNYAFLIGHITKEGGFSFDLKPPMSVCALILK